MMRLTCITHSKVSDKDQGKTSINLRMLSILRLIFLDLSEDSLLKTCMHGETQNANKAFYGVCVDKMSKKWIWAEVCWKLAFIPLSLILNKGYTWNDILGMNGSITCITSSASKDQASVSRSIMKSRQVKKQRKKLKAIKKGLINEEKEKEGKKS